MPKIVLNADDFGLAENINLGIYAAHKYGNVTSVSIVVCGGFVRNAIELLSLCELDVGIHLTITYEKPISPPQEISSIIGKDGKFLTMPEFVKLYLEGRINLNHVHKEWENQIRFLILNNIYPIHMDSHQHMHVLPGILDVALDLKRKFSIPFLRFEPMEPILSFNRLPRKTPYLLTKILTHSHKLLRKKIPGAYGFLGIGYSGGSLDLFKLSRLLKRVKKSDFIEVNLHPGLNHGMGSKIYQAWGFDWERDLELACHPGLKGFLTQMGYEPAGFRDIPFSKDL